MIKHIFDKTQFYHLQFPDSLPLFYQMEVYTVRMTSVLIVMMVSFNLHTKLIESFPI